MKKVVLSIAIVCVACFYTGNASAQNAAKSRPPSGIEARLDRDEQRMTSEFNLLQKLLEKPKPKGFWEENWQFLVGTFVVGLGVSPAVSFLYVLWQRRRDLSMALITQWISNFSTLQAPGIQNLRTHRLAMNQAQFDSVVELGNFYEVVATAIRYEHANARLFEHYGINSVMCEFRSATRNVANSVTHTSTAAERAVAAELNHLLANWDSMATICP